MSFSAGKPGAKAEDVLAALAKAAPDPNDPLAWVRSVVGDTMTTRGEISGYAATRKQLGCE